jgi:rare lipoprotein A
MRKKLITLFLFLSIVGLVMSQSLETRKQNAVASKDSLSKSKTLLVPHEFVPDSLFQATGKFKFYKKNAHASYYAGKFNGQKTASGTRYDQKKYTAAHKKLPFGTIVKVTNEANGKAVIVEINDRGPFVRSRDIDLSKRAFMEIANSKSSGVVIVTIEVKQK